MKYLKNFIGLFESLENSEDRIHFSDKEINTLRNTEQKQKPEFKPQGPDYTLGTLMEGGNKTLNIGRSGVTVRLMTPLAGLGSSPNVFTKLSGKF